MSDLVRLDIKEEHIAIVTMDRPTRAHALSKEMLDGLNEVLRSIDKNESIYCTIITSTGEKAFCAGADLKERSRMTTEQEVMEAVHYIGDTLIAIERMKMPVIAAINGVAFGGGLELALACDLRIAADDVRLGLPETSLAIIPGAGGTQRLPRLIGPGHAKRLIYTAKPIRASEALSIGLIEQVVYGKDLLTEALFAAKTIAANGPVSLKMAKAAIDEGLQTDISSGLEIERKHYLKTVSTQDRTEGIAAFNDKRKPVYKGK
ncbi:enoyl-CoA hydratase-related protein [Oceanobacillus massiliensis]|uniref:enoyl-CoA hydratase-related protein n=1 Tax=Oceanobacillus massiliensis TaxID=1465765 RepID=UPI00301725E8